MKLSEVADVDGTAQKLLKYGEEEDLSIMDMICKLAFESSKMWGTISTKKENIVLLYKRKFSTKNARLQED